MLRCRGAVLIGPPAVGRRHRSLLSASPVALKLKHRVVEFGKLPEVGPRHYRKLPSSATQRRVAPTPRPMPTPTPPPAEEEADEEKAAAEAASTTPPRVAPAPTPTPSPAEADAENTAAEAVPAPLQQPPPPQQQQQQQRRPSAVATRHSSDRAPPALPPGAAPQHGAGEGGVRAQTHLPFEGRIPDLPEGLSPHHAEMVVSLRRNWFWSHEGNFLRDLYPYPLEELLAHLSGGDVVEPSAVYAVLLDLVSAGPETVELVNELRAKGPFYRRILARPHRPEPAERNERHRKAQFTLAVMHDSAVTQLEDYVEGGRPPKLYRFGTFKHLRRILHEVRNMAHALHESGQSRVPVWTAECDHLLVRLVARHDAKGARLIMLGKSEDPHDVAITKTTNAETWNAFYQGLALIEGYRHIDDKNDKWEVELEDVRKAMQGRRIPFNHVSINYVINRFYNGGRYKAAVAVATGETSARAAGVRMVFSGETWAQVIKSLAHSTTPQAGLDLGEALKARVLEEYEGRYAAPDELLARAGKRYVDARLPLFPELQRGWLQHALLPLKFNTYLFHTLMEVATLLPDAKAAMAKLLQLANEFYFHAVPQMNALQLLKEEARSRDAAPMLPPSDDGAPQEADVVPVSPSEGTAAKEEAVGGDKERNEAYHPYFRGLLKDVNHPWTVYFKDEQLTKYILTICLTDDAENGAALVLKLLQDGYTLSFETIAFVATHVGKFCRALKFRRKKPDSAKVLAKKMLLELTTAVSEATRRYAGRWGDAKGGYAVLVKAAYCSPQAHKAMKAAQGDVDRALFHLALSTHDFSSCITAFTHYAESATRPTLKHPWIQASDLLKMLTVCAEHGRWKTAEAVLARYTSFSMQHSQPRATPGFEQSRVRDTGTTTSWFLMLNQIIKAHRKTPIAASDPRFDRFMELSLQACLRGGVLDFEVVQECLRLLADRALAEGGGDPLVNVQNRDPKTPLGIDTHKLLPRAYPVEQRISIVEADESWMFSPPQLMNKQRATNQSTRKLPVSLLSTELLLAVAAKRRWLSTPMLHQAIRVWLATDDPQAIPSNLLPLLKKTSKLQAQFVDAVLRCCDKTGHVACRRVVEEFGAIEQKSDIVKLTTVLEAAADAQPEGAELEGLPAGNAGASKLMNPPSASLTNILALAPGSETLEEEPPSEPQKQADPSSAPVRQRIAQKRHHRFEHPELGRRAGE